MTRADFLKQLFRAYKTGDRERFMEAAREIADEERRKQHPALANELLRILNNGAPVPSPTLGAGFSPVPRDGDRRTPLLDIRHPDRFLRDLILSGPIIETLTTVIREFQNWEVLEANGLRPSHRLLFCGPPGCGKTATAEALAGEVGLPLLYIRFDAVVSSLLGETAANLRKLFDYAGQDSWIILFDEFDAIGRSRDDASEHGELKRVVNSFLQMLDSFKGRSIIIAATNFEQALDPALWRRFDEIIRFDRPTVEQIKRLMAIRLAPIGGDELNLGGCARKLCGSSFGDVERVCVDVLKQCAIEGRSRASQQQLLAAVRRQEERKRILAESRPTETPRVDEP